MALAVVKVLPDLPQVQVAASVLRAAGFHPVLMDAGVGSVLWTLQLAIGGFRLAVPADEAVAAAALLQPSAHLDPDPEDAPPPPPTGDLFRSVAGVVLLVAGGPECGWLAARRRPLGLEGWMGVLLVAAAMIGLALLLYMAGRVLHPAGH